MRYLSQDLRDEAIRAHQQGQTLETLAGKLRITVAELRLVLGLPLLK